MKRTIFIILAGCMLVSSCSIVGLNPEAKQTGSTIASNALSSVASSITNTETLTNILTSFIGADKVTSQSLVGNWTYDSPGCAFSSEKLLAKAGGEAIATSIEKQLVSPYSKVGFSPSNTMINIAADGTFTATILGRQWSGKWTFNEDSQQLKLTGLILNINCYTKRNGTGISILFEATKLLKAVQTFASSSNNTVVSTISNISSNYDGVRLGFDMK